MSYRETTFTCRDCERRFSLGIREQKEFMTRGFKPPTRCPECHEKRSSRRKYSRGGECKTHIAPCSVCGKNAELPFQPTNSKPVYCTECFRNKQDADNPNRKSFALRKPEKQQPQVSVPADENSFTQFKLDHRLMRAVHDAGFTIPTPVQSAAIPFGLEGRDIVGTAQTGTGKTAAFVLPILQHLLANPVPKPCTRVVVLTPTRELAEQVGDTFRQLGRFTKIKTATVYGGVAMSPQEQALQTGVEVIVACPGRLLDHIDRGNTDFRHVENLVLDEADRMLDMGFLPPIKRIISCLPKARQSMLFSATFAPELMQLVKDSLTDPKRVNVDISAPAKTVAHALYPCPQHLKTSLVLRLLDKTDANSVLIFTRTKHRADRVAKQITRAGYGAAVLHADRSQNQRQAALDNFREGRCQVLVATDIAARGLDVETISHVINYDIPDTADTYIHRIGRTGRAEREGDAMTLITTEDSAVVWDIEKTLGGPIERRTLEDFDYTAPPQSPRGSQREPAQQGRPKNESGRRKATANEHRRS